MIKTVPYILMLGCFDTKGEVFHYLRQRLIDHGQRVVTINTGIMGSTALFPVDIDAELVAREGGHEIQELRDKQDRGFAVAVMGKGVARIVEMLYNEGGLKGAIGMGGGGGTFMALSAMGVLPLGVPKICISTLAAKDLSHVIGSKDITLMPSVVDVAGLNSISRVMIRQAAAAVTAMSNEAPADNQKYTGRVAISMFGNTTPCVDQCTSMLQEQGYEVFAFHANGQGGRTMEALIRENYFDGVLDITTTELADELCGGICSAGSSRMEGAGEMGLPQVVVPGCMDMINFGPIDTVPERYKDRHLYSWAPDVTLMRTNEEENLQLGERLAAKVNRALGPSVV
ncbi:MAG TPA: Tm-1-like ATP-binding domain-containing protein, partial [Cyclobacteriaceae bacterium]|nr:Tm-1-like ATP-binding domain-containing protein [Cyclobacteriaceae bacterium]